jgi:hypothetical protein
MPTYTFKNTETGETFDQFMSMSSREQFMKDNPQLESVIGATAMVRETPRVPDGFRDVLRKIHDRMPGSVLKDNIR